MRKDIVIRVATSEDVPGIVSLEEAVWRESGANEEKIVSRIVSFQQGNVVAFLDDEVVGYLCFEYVNDMRHGPDFTWSDITDDGYIAKSHKSAGEFFYGVNMSVHYSVNGLNVGTLLMIQGWRSMIIDNKKGAFAGSRVPGFRNYKEKHQGVTIEKYVQLRRKNGNLRDYELHLYETEGLRSVRILPSYFPDPESLDYGVLVFRRNPFYNVPFRRFFAWVISTTLSNNLRKSVAIEGENHECLY